ncbi:MAG: efflux RND transporter periplasmic adaptor subunit [Oscillospiraceae bacterium]|nr:efflux RND transporter periplasmic adaptor subunit [Oscillospiraceae bacterium]
MNTLGTSIKKSVFGLATAAAMCLSLSGCYFLPEEEEYLDPPVVKASEVSYTTTTATLKDITKQVTTSGTIASGTEENVYFASYGGTIKAVYVSAGDEVEEGDLIAELETTELDEEIYIMELEMQREELEVQIAIENGESETVKAKEQLDVDLLQIDLDKLYAEKEASKIYATVSGTISYVKTVSPGQTVSAGSTIATIIDLSDLYIKISPSSEKSAFLIGRSITIKYDGETYDGIIVSNSSGEQWDSQTEGVLYDENGDAILGEISEDVVVAFVDEFPESSSVGNIADTVLVLDSRENVIVISANLIKTVNGQDVVYVFKDNERVQVAVTTGLQSGSLVEITSGLEEGDEVIIR